MWHIYVPKYIFFLSPGSSEISIDKYKLFIWEIASYMCISTRRYLPRDRFTYIIYVCICDEKLTRKWEKAHQYKVNATHRNITFSYIYINAIYENETYQCPWTIYNKNLMKTEMRTWTNIFSFFFIQENVSELSKKKSTKKWRKDNNIINKKYCHVFYFSSYWNESLDNGTAIWFKIVVISGTSTWSETRAMQHEQHLMFIGTGEYII